MTETDPKYGNQGSFEVCDPEVDIAKVQDYVDWKQSRWRYPIHEYARKRHWGYWHVFYGKKWWPRNVWQWMWATVMSYTCCIHSAYSLNRIEKIRAGLLLGQHRSPRFWIDGSICHDG